MSDINVSNFNARRTKWGPGYTDEVEEKRCFTLNIKQSVICYAMWYLCVLTLSAISNPQGPTPLRSAQDASYFVNVTNNPHEHSLHWSSFSISILSKWLCSTSPSPIVLLLVLCSHNLVCTLSTHPPSMCPSFLLAYNKTSPSSSQIKTSKKK